MHVPERRRARSRPCVRQYHETSGHGGTTGKVVTAASGIEIALRDAAGKLLDLPVYQLLGGKYRDEVRMYCDCHAGEAYAPEAERVAITGRGPAARSTSIPDRGAVNMNDGERIKRAVVSYATDNPDALPEETVERLERATPREDSEGTLRIGRWLLETRDGDPVLTHRERGEGSMFGITVIHLEETDEGWRVRDVSEEGHRRR